MTGRKDKWLKRFVNFLFGHDLRFAYWYRKMQGGSKLAKIKGFDTDSFPITLVSKLNGGKHTALNASHEHIHGKYVLILDSDDRLAATAVAQVKAAWDKYADNEEIGVVTFLKGETETEPNCTADDEGVPVDILRYRRRIIRTNDCCEVIRTELFKKYPFPEYEGERFVSECALWNRVRRICPPSARTP